MSSTATPPDFSALVDVVLPAGGRIEGEFARQAGTDIKAMIRLENITLLRRVIEALRQTGRVRHIMAIGPESVQREAFDSGADGVCDERATGPENILAGLEALAQQKPPTPRVLIVPTDLPFVTPRAFCTFLDACPDDADIALPTVTAQSFQARFPGSQNEFVRLADGAYTLGGAFLVRPQAVLANRIHLERMFAARKDQFQMARLIGPVTVVKWLTHRLTVADIAARASQILQCRGVAVPDAPPELAFDIDLPVEYEYAVHTLNKNFAARQPAPASSPEAVR